MLDNKRDDYIILRTVKLKEFIKNQSLETDKFSISYKYNYNPLVNPNIQEQTVLEDIIVTIKAINKQTEQMMETSFSLFNLPVLTSTGFKLDGTLYQMQDSYRRATGWYITKEKEINTLSLITDGNLPNYRIFEKKDNLVISRVKGKDFSLAKFLKALTGLSYKELLKEMGDTNPLLIREFNIKCEPTLDECVQEAVKLVGDNTGSKDTLQLARNIRRKILNEGLEVLNKNSMTVSGPYTSRLKEMISFRRALGLKLAKSYGEFKEDTLITEEVVSYLDSSDLSELKVKYSNKILTIIKKPVVESNSLQIEDFYNTINTFSLVREGIDLYDRMDESYNKEVYSFTDQVEDLIKRSLTSLNNYIVRSTNPDLVNVITSAINTCIISKDKDIRHYLERQIKSGSKDSQTSDMNNSIAYAVRSYKAYDDNDKNVSVERRGIYNSYLGIFDAFNSPESKKVGLNHTRTLESLLVGRQLMTRLIDVRNSEIVDTERDGKVFRTIKRGKIVELSPKDYENKVVSMWDIDFGADKVNAIKDGKGISVSPSEVDYLIMSQFNIVSIGTGNINFLNHIDGKRDVMASNQNGQKIYTLGSERSFIGTGMCGTYDIGIIRAKEIMSSYASRNGIVHEEISKMEEFLKTPIKLIRTRVSHQDRVLIFEADIDGKKETIEYPIPYMIKNEKNTLFTTRIVQGKSVFSGNDIVCHNIDVDVDTDNKYSYIGESKVNQWYKDNNIEDKIVDIKDDNTIRFNPVENIDYGYKIPPSDFMKSDLLLGRNLYVAFKTFEGTTVDDSITISSKLVGLNLMTSVNVKLIERDLTDNNGDIPEIELPSVGEYVGPNSTLFTIIKRKNGNINRVEVKTSAVDSGQIISATKVGKFVSILLADLAPIKPGDKGTGEHGNKGVVARIVPYEQMPYSKETGRPVDICLNPLGIPTRMNPGQLLVVKIAQALREMTRNGQEKRVILSQFNPITKQLTESLINDKDISELGELANSICTFKKDAEVLIDGRTGKPFDRKIETGLIYFSKLEHTVKSKVAQVEVPKRFDSKTGRPNRGKEREGGQKIGEMENIILQLQNAPNLSDYLYNMRMDSDNAKNGLIKSMITGDSSEVNFESRGRDHIKMVLYSMLVNIEVEGNKYKTGPLTDNMIQALNVKPINADTNDVRDILQSKKMFGDSRTRNKGDKNFSTRWGYIDLKTKIPSPVQIEKSFLSKLFLCFPAKNKILTQDNFYEFKSPVFCSSSLFSNMIKHGVYVKIQNSVLYIYNKKGEDVPKEKKKELESHGYVTGVRGVVSILENTNTKELYTNMKEKVEKLSSKEHKIYAVNDKSSKAVKYQEILSRIEVMLDNNIKLSDYVVSKFPVMPLAYRYNERAGEDKTRSDFDDLYCLIVSAVSNDDTESVAFNVYKAVCQFQGIDNSFRLDNKEDLRKFLQKDGKSDKGFLRTSMKGTRVPFSGRSVIIPDTTMKLNPYQVGIPFFQILDACKSFYKYKISKNQSLMNKWNLNIDLDKAIDYIQANNYKDLAKLLGNKSVEEAYECWEDVFNFVADITPKELIAMCGRQPTLHPSSWMGYFPVVVKGHAIELHPSTCKAYNADFDGDQMHWEIIPTKEAKEEVMRYFMVDSNMVNYKDGSNLLIPTQDILVGLYLTTMLYDNITDIYKDDRYKNVIAYNNLNKLKNDIESKEIDRNCLVVYNHTNGNKYLSTAGRIYFNSLLVNGFTDKPFTNTLNIQTELIHEGYPVINPDNYKELLYDGLIAGKGSTQSTKEEDKKFRYISVGGILTDCTKNNGVNCTIKLVDDMKVLGFTAADKVGISVHLKDFVHSDKRDKIKDTIAKKISELEMHYKMGLIDESTKTSIEERLNDLTKKKILEGILEPFTRNNNLFILADSGARGSKENILQTCGIIGHVSAGKKGTMPTPVLSNYVEGLTPHEYTICANGTMMGFAEQQLGVAESGYMANKSAHLLEGMIVSEEDCGVNKEQSTLSLSYNMLKFVRDDSLLGKTITTDDKDLNMILEESNGVVTKDNIHYILAPSLPLYCNGIELDIFDIKDGIIGQELSPTTPKFKNVEYTLVDGKITDDTYEILVKKTVPRIDIMKNNDIKSFYLFYNLSEKQKSQLLSRYTEDEKLIKTGLLSEKQTITEEAIAYIEKFNIRKLSYRTLITCRTNNGICAKCYGLKHNTYNKNYSSYEELQESKDLNSLVPEKAQEDFPPVGTRVGLIASTIVGELMTQTKLDKVNKGAGSKDSGTNDLTYLLNGKQLKERFNKDNDFEDNEIEEGLIAPVDSLVKVENLGESSIVTLIPSVAKLGDDINRLTNDERDKLSSNLCINRVVDNSRVCVKNMQLVDSGEQVIEGYTPLDSVLVIARDYKGTLELLREKQVRLYDQYCDRLITNGKGLEAKNIELFARVQSSVAKIIESDNPKYKVGDNININELEKALEEGSKINVIPVTPSPKTIHKYYNDPLKGLLFENIMEQISYAGVSNEYKESNSYVTKVCSGSPSISDGYKMITRLSKPDEVLEETVVTLSDEDLNNSESIQEQYKELVEDNLVNDDLSDLDLDLDLGDLDNVEEPDYTSVGGKDSFDFYDRARKEYKEEVQDIKSNESTDGVSLEDIFTDKEETLDELFEDEDNKEETLDELFEDNDNEESIDDLFIED